MRGTRARARGCAAAGCRPPRRAPSMPEPRTSAQPMKPPACCRCSTWNPSVCTLRPLAESAWAAALPATRGSCRRRQVAQDDPPPTERRAVRTAATIAAHRHAAAGAPPGELVLSGVFGDRGHGPKILVSRFGSSVVPPADAGSCLPVHGIREHAGGT